MLIVEVDSAFFFVSLRGLGWDVMFCPPSSPPPCGPAGEGKRGKGDFFFWRLGGMNGWMDE